MKINLITGTMGAGKSTRLIEDLNKFRQLGKSATVVKASTTEHNLGEVTSRRGTTTPCMILNVQQSGVETLAKLFSFIYNEDNIIPQILLVDESQFLTIEQITAIEHAALIFDMDIIFYGLSLDFTGTPFESTAHIIEISDNVQVIFSVCELEGCSETAVYNGRFSNGQLIKKGDTFLEEKSVYKALCVNHFENNCRF